MFLCSIPTYLKHVFTHICSLRYVHLYAFSRSCFRYFLWANETTPPWPRKANQQKQLRYCVKKSFATWLKLATHIGRQEAYLCLTCPFLLANTSLLQFTRFSFLSAFSFLFFFEFIFFVFYLWYKYFYRSHCSCTFTYVCVCMRERMRACGCGRHYNHLS